MGQRSIKNERKAWKKEARRCAHSDLDLLIDQNKEFRRKIRYMKHWIISLTICVVICAVFLFLTWAAM